MSKPCASYLRSVPPLRRQGACAPAIGIITITATGIICPVRSVVVE